MTIESFNIEGETAAATATNYDMTVRADGELNGETALIFPPGPEGDLHINFLRITTDGVSSKLITTPNADQPYVSGDDNKYPFWTTKKVKAGDTLRVETDNVDAVNAHAFNLLFSIKYDTLQEV